MDVGTPLLEERLTVKSIIDRIKINQQHLKVPRPIIDPLTLEVKTKVYQQMADLEAEIVKFQVSAKSNDHLSLDSNIPLNLPQADISVVQDDIKAPPPEKQEPVSKYRPNKIKPVSSLRDPNVVEESSYQTLNPSKIEMI